MEQLLKYTHAHTRTHAHTHTRTHAHAHTHTRTRFHRDPPWFSDTRGGEEEEVEREEKDFDEEAYKHAVRAYAAMNHTDPKVIHAQTALSSMRFT